MYEFPSLAASSGELQVENCYDLKAQEGIDHFARKHYDFGLLFSMTEVHMMAVVWWRARRRIVSFTAVTSFVRSRMHPKS